MLQHEKYSSQLQMNLKGSEVKKAETEDRTRTTSSKSLPQGKHGSHDRKLITMLKVYVDFTVCKTAESCFCVCVLEASVSRPTPLYGQPSWWGEEDYGSKVHSSDEHHAGALPIGVLAVSGPASLYANMLTDDVGPGRMFRNQCFSST